MTLASLVSAALLVVGGVPESLPPPPAPPAPSTGAPLARDPEAMALVKRMCDRLRQARTFTVKARTSLELPQAGEALATFFNTAAVAVRRPDGLAASRSGDLPEFRFAYDGRTMTALAVDQGAWGTAAAPPTLDAMLAAAGEQGSLSLPFDELLVADPWAAVTSGLTAAVRLGPVRMGGRTVEHVALALGGLQLEFWIDPATGLPARELVIYADHPLRPHFSVELTDWALDPKLPASTFALPRPAGASQVEFRVAAGAFR